MLLLVPGSEAADSSGKASTGKTKSSKKEVSKATTSSKNPKKSTKRQPLAKITKEQESKALGFAKSHHQELAVLLSQLKKNNAGQYRKAVRELSSTSDRLNRLNDRSPDRHELALREWKLDSRIRLLAARMIMSADPELEAKLKSYLLARRDLRLESFIKERDRLEIILARSKSRLDKLNDDIRTLESVSPDTLISRDLDSLKKSVGGARKKSAKFRELKKKTSKAKPTQDTSRKKTATK